jgi:hypothetical protein
MKASNICAILVRLFAILLLLKAFQQAMLFYEAFPEGTIDGMEVSLYFMGILTGSPLLFGLLLWFFPLFVSRSIVKPEIDTELTPIHLEPLIIVLMVALGLYILSYALSDLIYNVTIIHLESRDEVPGGGSPEAKASLIATIFEIIAGLFLVSRARFISTKILSVVR